jgi:hypothetical protein
MWMEDIRHLREGGWNPEYVYPEDGKTLQEMQPESHFWIPWYAYWIFCSTRWIHEMSEQFCRLWAGKED